MSYVVAPETFDSLSALWTDRGLPLKWNHIFVLPAWMKAWWQHFGKEAELRLLSIRDGDGVLGVAPLMVRDGTARVVGGPDLCDYADFVMAPGREADFCGALLDQLDEGVTRLDLGPVRADSFVLTHLAGTARGRGLTVEVAPEEVSLELELPATWEDYLARLDAKQRHELGRKLRRLGERGGLAFRAITTPAGAAAAMDGFLKLFSDSRSDKAAFLTGERESFFRTVADAMAELGLLRMGMLELDGRPVAMVMCFDFDGCVYLYNSGYDPEYRDLSVGVLSKALSVKDSIEQKKQRYDFLKGGETYKYHLGGKEVPLYRCRIAMRRATRS